VVLLQGREHSYLDIDEPRLRREVQALTERSAEGGG